MPGTLYVVSTPIGNLEDISLRALRILKEAALIAAEDTRVTRKLLTHFDIHTPLTSFHEHTRGEKIDSLLQRLESGEDVALVSDAGTPAVSDPGADLIARAIDAGIRVVPVPGPSAPMAALIASGLPAGRFAFDGFPPRAKGDRRAFFESLRNEPRTLILFEAPTRLVQTLVDLYAALGDRRIAVAREMTKLFEETFRGTLSEAVSHFHAHRPRGELTLVIAGAGKLERTAAPPRDVRAALLEKLSAGATSRDAIQAVSADLGLPRKTVYREMLEIERQRS